VQDRGAGLLLCKQLVVRLVEVIENFLAQVGDKIGEVGEIRQLESEYRGVVSAQALQFGHRPTLLGESSVGRLSWRRAIPLAPIAATRRRISRLAPKCLIGWEEALPRRFLRHSSAHQGSPFAC
jgi:hypothetical protein